MRTGSNSGKGTTDSGSAPVTSRRADPVHLDHFATVFAPDQKYRDLTALAVFKRDFNG
jgi:hypothetical protein